MFAVSAFPIPMFGRCITSLCLFAVSLCVPLFLCLLPCHFSLEKLIWRGRGSPVVKRVLVEWYAIPHWFLRQCAARATALSDAAHQSRWRIDATCVGCGSPRTRSRGVGGLCSVHVGCNVMRVIAGTIRL